MTFVLYVIKCKADICLGGGLTTILGLSRHPHWQRNPFPAKVTQPTRIHQISLVQSCSGLNPKVMISDKICQLLKNEFFNESSMYGINATAKQRCHQCIAMYTDYLQTCKPLWTSCGWIMLFTIYRGSLLPSDSWFMSTGSDPCILHRNAVQSQSKFPLGPEKEMPKSKPFWTWCVPLLPTLKSTTNECFMQLPGKSN